MKKETIKTGIVCTGFGILTGVIVGCYRVIKAQEKTIEGLDRCVTDLEAICRSVTKTMTEHLELDVKEFERRKGA